jgi:hypothetical protein
MAPALRFGRRGLPLILSWLVPFLVYAASARRDVWFWDTGEMDTVPWIAGIAHPTGFPAYVVLGWLFSHAVPFGPVAFRMSLMSALAMSVAAYFVARCVEDEDANPWLAAACAWLFAFGSLAWTHATRAEVHAVALAAVAAMIFFSLRWYGDGKRRDLFLTAAIFGVGFAVHPLVVLLVPGLLLLVLARIRRISARELAAACALALVSAAVWFAYLPLRSAYVSAHALDPTAALGLSGNAFWDYDHPASLRGFVALTQGSAFTPLDGLKAIFSPQTYRALPDYFGQLYSEMTAYAVSMAVGGIAAAWSIGRVRTIALLLFGITCIPFGLGFAPESDPHRYYLTSFLVGAILCGDAALWLAKRLPYENALPFLILGTISAVLLAQGRWIFALAGDERARAVIDDVRHSTPANAIVVANWLDAPPLAYAAYVERSFGSRIVEPAWLGDVAAKLPLWMKERPVFAVGDGQSAPGYRLAAVSKRSSVSRVVVSIAAHP